MRKLFAPGSDFLCRRGTESQIRALEDWIEDLITHYTGRAPEPGDESLDNFMADLQSWLSAAVSDVDEAIHFHVDDLYTEDDFTWEYAKERFDDRIEDTIRLNRPACPDCTQGSLDEDLTCCECGRIYNLVAPEEPTS